jgi:ribosomal protein L13
MQTPFTSSDDAIANRKWFVVDLEGQPLGRAAAKIANRLIEAADRNFWQPDAETMAALQAATDAIEDQLEGVAPAGSLAA